jgi:flagellar biosynthesis/type III secretory pathway chaperone
VANLQQIFSLQLQQELAVARTLHRLLCEERELLDPPNVKALTDLQQEKLLQLNTLKELSNQRCHWLTEQQIPLNKHCYLSPLLQSDIPSDNQQLADLWQQLADQFEQNRDLTEILATIVLTARQRTQSLMKILRGQKNTPNLYTKSGQTQLGSAGLGYAKA